MLKYKLNYEDSTRGIKNHGDKSLNQRRQYHQCGPGIRRIYKITLHKKSRTKSRRHHIEELYSPKLPR